MAENAAIQLDEGKFIVHVKALQKDIDEPSVMGNYLSESAIITNEGGSYFLTMMLKNQQIITGFQVENKEAIERQINEDTDARFELFELDNVPVFLPARVQYETEYEGQEIKGDEELRLFLDKESIEKAE